MVLYERSKSYILHSVFDLEIRSNPRFWIDERYCKRARHGGKESHTQALRAIASEVKQSRKNNEGL